MGLRVAFLVGLAAGSPLTEVVKLLQEMLEKSRSDGEDERAEFAKFTCECNAAFKNHKAAINAADELIASTTATLNENLGTNGVLSKQIAQLAQDLRDNKASEEEATNTRGKQKETFEAKETDLTEAMAKLGDAISTLAGVGADQTDEGTRDKADSQRFLKSSKLMSIRSRVQHDVQAVTDLLPPADRHTVNSFLQAPFSGTYMPQSGQIVGILKNMKDTFESDLSEARRTEEKRQKAYDALIKLLTEERETMTKLKTAKEEKLGNVSDAIASNRETIAAAEEDLADNQESLKDREESCAEETRQYEKRKVIRAEEEAAVAEAISILNSDAAFDNKTLNREAMFAQIRAHVQKDEKSPFDTVLTEIEKMLTAIEEERKADKEKKEWCEAENTKNDAEQIRTDDAQDMAETKKAGHEKTIEETTEVLNEKTDALKTLREDREAYVANRREENMNYQKNIADLTHAEETLDQALRVLESFYRKTEKQTFDREDSSYKGQGEQGNKVLGLIEEIHGDVRSAQKEAHTAEHDTQKAFETDMTDFANTEQDLKDAIGEAKQTIATENEGRATAVETLAREKAIEERLTQYKAKLKPGCDFMLDNYSDREGKRDNEKKQLETVRDKVRARVESHGKVAGVA